MTYSIVAYDPETKQFSVAVQTHVPSVGSGVSWVKPGVGAIATQSITNIGFGPLGLELLAGGVNAENTLAALLASDPGADQRQVSVIDKEGKVATYTGERCIPFACLSNRCTPDGGGKGSVLNAAWLPSSSSVGPG